MGAAAVSLAVASIGATRLGDGKVTKVGVVGTRAVGVVDDQLIYMRDNVFHRAILFNECFGRLFAYAGDAGDTINGIAPEAQNIYYL